LREGIREWIRITQQKKEESRFTLLSLDIPSGSTNLKSTTILYPDEIAELGTRKWENLFSESSKSFHPIGFAIPNKNSINHYATQAFLYSKEELRNTLQVPNNSHKYTKGSLSVVGGFEGMEGAGILAISSFLNFGGGIAKIYTNSEKARECILGARPGIMTGVWKDGIDFLAKSQACLLGPGTSMNSFDLGLLQDYDKPIVVDGGLIPESKSWKKRFGTTLFTPHIGELKRLLNTPENEPDILIPLAEKFSNESGVYILIKSHHSYLIQPGENILVFPYPNPKLATMGTGDLLAGLVSLFLCQGKSVEESVKISMSILHLTVFMKSKSPDSDEILKYIKEEINGP
jgi:hydroxyethylthiazole kinase-like uncharacterized protein yjeF